MSISTNEPIIVQKITNSEAKVVQVTSNLEFTRDPDVIKVTSQPEAVKKMASDEVIYPSIYVSMLKYNLLFNADCFTGID